MVGLQLGIDVLGEEYGSRLGVVVGGGRGEMGHAVSDTESEQAALQLL